MSDKSGWERIYGPVIDVTGDDFGDLCMQYGLTSRTERDGSDILTNSDGTIRMTWRPFWNACVGQTYELTVEKRDTGEGK